MKQNQTKTNPHRESRHIPEFLLNCLSILADCFLDGDLYTSEVTK